MQSRILMVIIAAGLLCSGCTGGGSSNSFYPATDFIVSVKSGSEVLVPVRISTTEVTMSAAKIKVYSANAMSGLIEQVSIGYYHLGTLLTTVQLAGLTVPYQYTLNQPIPASSKSNPVEFSVNVYHQKVYDHMVGADGTVGTADDKSDVEARLTFFFTDSLDRYVAEQTLSVNLNIGPK
ncbi:MAG: hypothetical protein PHQ23_05750 [Candidatus Wallbacteria bacterium]|nr:hypothetical protein [Candidatus Wallbacteria bacterium]